MRSKRWSLIAVMSLAAACGGSTKQAAPPAVPDQPVPTEPTIPDEVEAALPAIPSSPAPAPDGLFVTAHADNPSALIAAIGTFADAIQPGVKAMFTTELLVATAASEGIDLRGVDLTRPVRVIMLDPSRYPQPLVAVVGVADQAALGAAATQIDMRMQVHNGFAAIGTADALIAAGGYALTTLATAPIPTVPTMEVNVAAVMQRHGAAVAAKINDIASAADPAQREMIAKTMQLYAGLLDQLAALTVTLELVGDHASVVMRMAPRSGTALATFIGKQGPATFALLDQLPGGIVTMGGRLDLQQIWAAMGEMMAPMMASTYGAGAPTVMAFWKQWTELETGETAMSIDVTKQAFGASGLWEVAAPAAAAAMWSDYLAAIAKSPMPTVAFVPSSSKHRGVKLSMVAVTPDKSMPDDQRAIYQRMGGTLRFGFAVVDKRVALGIGTDAAARVKALIDLSKGAVKKKARPSPLAPVVAEAKRRGESYLFTIDLEAMKSQFASMLGNGPGPMPSGVNEPSAFAVGTADGALTWRITVPAAQAKIIATM